MNYMVERVVEREKERMVRDELRRWRWQNQAVSVALLQKHFDCNTMGVEENNAVYAFTAGK